MMRQTRQSKPEIAEQIVRDIRRATLRHYSPEAKIRIVLEGVRGEESIAELCRKEGINQNLYYRLSTGFSKPAIGEAVVELALERPERAR